MACLCGDLYCPSCGPAQGVPQQCESCGASWRHCVCPICDACGTQGQLNDEQLCAECLVNAMDELIEERDFTSEMEAAIAVVTNWKR